MSDGAWDTVCDSLQAHPTLEVLDLRLGKAIMTPEPEMKSRLQVLVDMLKVNMWIHTIG
jgi:hypothetical protein